MIIISIFLFLVGISFPSLSTTQSCTVSTSCKILCRVRAKPAAVTDWKRVDSVKQLEGAAPILSLSHSDGVTDAKYLRLSDGLLIRNVSVQDEGGYICRARVAQTGQLEERIIQLKVILAMLLLQVMTISLPDTRGSNMD